MYSFAYVPSSQSSSILVVCPDSMAKVGKKKKKKKTSEARGGRSEPFLR